MASVNLTIGKLEVKNWQTAPAFDISDNAGKLGELTPSSGGVYWLKSGQQGKPHFITWKDFAKFMESQDRKD
ncbi:MAG: hypothetical protein SGJ23_02520 [Alphaproteobacteria bacterium]|nr:hypothetical protein [Alphaproteobacteria bacterium]